MNSDDDLPPTDMTRLRSALEQRAGGGPSTEPAALLASAQRRAGSLHRQHVAGGALAVLLCVGLVAGALIANHGRATVGVSVAGSTDTTEAPPTTLGNGGMPMVVPCGDTFFSPSTWTSLEDHFGPKMDCGRAGTTWIVTFRGTAITAAALICDAGDAECLDASAQHDFDSFKAVFLPPVSSATAGASWSWVVAASRTSGASDVELTWLPPVPPTPTPVPTIRVSGQPSDVAMEYAVSCEPVEGPLVTHWAGKPMPLMSAAEALAALVPDWTSKFVGPANPC